MDRLTMWYDGYHGICERVGCANHNTESCALAREDGCDALCEILAKLGAYEDTGLTPEEVAQMQEWWAQVPAIIESRVKRICEGEFTREEAQNALHKHCCDCVHCNVCGGEKIANDCARYEPRNNREEAEAALAENGASK